MIPAKLRRDPSGNAIADSGRRRVREGSSSNLDEVVKSLSYRHPGERRGPEHPEKAGFFPDSIRDPPE
jgi:hypothetical protein